MYIEDFHIREQIRTRLGRAIVDTAKLSDKTFETMVFGIRHNGEIDYARPLDVATYPTLEEAEKGHAAMMAKWRI